MISRMIRLMRLMFFGLIGFILTPVNKTPLTSDNVEGLGLNEKPCGVLSRTDNRHSGSIPRPVVLIWDFVFVLIIDGFVSHCR